MRPRSALPVRPSHLDPRLAQPMAQLSDSIERNFIKHLLHASIDLRAYLKVRNFILLREAYGVSSTDLPAQLSVLLGAD